MRVLLPCCLLLFAVRVEAQQREEASLNAQTASEADSLRARLDTSEMTAERAYALGVELFQRKRYADAELAWLRSYELDPKPGLLVAIANTRQDRGDSPGAVKMLERYLQERPDAPDRASIEARVAILRETPAKVRVRSTEPGAAILLNGKPTGRSTPSELELPPGEHAVVVVDAKGRRADEQRVNVSYGETKELRFRAEGDAPSQPGPEEVSTRSPTVADTSSDKAVPTAVWVTSGVAAAALVSGTVLGVVALREERDFDDNPTTRGADRSDRIALFAQVSLGLAAGAAITALALYLTSRNKRKRSDSRNVTLQVDPRGAGLSASVEF